MKKKQERELCKELTNKIGIPISMLYDAPKSTQKRFKTYKTQA